MDGLLPAVIQNFSIDLRLPKGNFGHRFGIFPDKEYQNQTMKN
jgi:hypothetical protein